MSDIDSTQEEDSILFLQTSNLDSGSDSDSSDVTSSTSHSSTDSTEDSVSKTYGSVKISLIKDEIKNQQVDVIVNSTSATLDLTQGSASRALLQSAGDSIQQECKDNYPDGISEMSLAVTGGGNLQCSHVYHINLQKWRGERNKKVLKKLVLNCLNQASTAGLSSIAIPALGTGLLKYDIDLVAKCMYSCVKHFEQENTDTTLTDVRFIIYPADAATYNTFLKRIRRTPDQQGKVVQSTKVGQIEVKLVTGQLINQNCQVVMTTVTRKLDLSKGTLSQWILDSAGASLQTECSTNYPNGIQHGEIAVLSSGNMTCQKIYCGALPRFDKPATGSENPSQLLTKLVTACLKEASNGNLASICFPTLGTGYLMYPPETSASLMFTAITDFAVNNGNSSLRTVVVVIHSTAATVSKLLEPFKSKHSAIIPAATKRPVPVPRREKLPQTENALKVLPRASTTKIKSSLSRENLPQTENALKVLPRASTTRIKSRLSTENLGKIEKLLQRKPTSKLRLAKIGAVPIIPVVSEPIKTSSPEEEVCVDGATAIPSRNTPAFCMHMYQLEIYPPQYWTVYTNNKTVKQWKVMETGKPGFTLIDVTGSMLNSIVKLVTGTWQQDKIGQGRDAKGLSSLGFTGLKVTKVQRIENLKLYESYRQKQQNLFHKAGEGSLFKKLTDLKAKFGDPKTESQLDAALKDTLHSEVNEGYFFHGTKDKNVDGLVKDGIDPRLAQGQAVFGQGIYMAESSTKADQYADERGDDTRRNKNLKMFLVRCNLGNICLMKTVKKFRRPPCCETDCLSDDCAHDNRYDSVVEEEKYIFREFVVYEGGQSYPEYLITYDRV